MGCARRLRFNLSDAETFILETEFRAMTGEVGVDEAVDAIHSYLEDNGFDEYWDLRMELFQEKTD